MKILMTTILMVMLSLVSIAQSISVEVSNDKVLLDHTFEATLTLENIENGKAHTLDLSEFTIVNQNTSSSISIINGEKSSKLIYKYTLLADQLGDFTIPSLSIPVGEEYLYTEPIVISVVDNIEEIDDKHTKQKVELDRKKTDNKSSIIRTQKMKRI